MSRIGLSILALVLAPLAACATTGHATMNGSVIMKVSETEAHVCLLDQDATIGTRVQLYRHNCTAQNSRAGTPDTKQAYDCQKQLVAVGTIAQRMGGHYAVVTFPQGTSYEEGFTVEPVR